MKWHPTLVWILSKLGLPYPEPPPTGPRQTFVFARTQKQFYTYCQRNDLKPFSRDVHGVSTSDAIRGFKINKRDKVVKLEGFRAVRRYDDVYLATRAAGVDLEKVPYTRA